jgi:hypothetical protein
MFICMEIFNTCIELRIKDLADWKLSFLNKKSCQPELVEGG